MSCRILRNSCNTSRGIGFARMSTRAAAEAVIAKLDDSYLQNQAATVPLQARFADSASQKALKGETQKRRQVRIRSSSWTNRLVASMRVQHVDRMF